MENDTKFDGITDAQIQKALSTYFELLRKEDTLTADEITRMQKEFFSRPQIRRLTNAPNN